MKTASVTFSTGHPALNKVVELHMASGLSGVNGTDGADGKDGQPGINGKDGRDGTDGKDGADGRNGADGAVATISIGNVYTGEAGTQASVVNRGTENDAILDFTIPRGADGAGGSGGDTGGIEEALAGKADIDPSTGHILPSQVAPFTGEVTGNYPSLKINNSAIMLKTLDGVNVPSNAGSIGHGDTLITAMNKLQGQIENLKLDKGDTVSAWREPKLESDMGWKVNYVAYCNSSQDVSGLGQFTINDGTVLGNIPINRRDETRSLHEDFEIAGNTWYDLDALSEEITLRLFNYGSSSVLFSPGDRTMISVPGTIPLDFWAYPAPLYKKGYADVQLSPTARCVYTITYTGKYFLVEREVYSSL